MADRDQERAERSGEAAPKKKSEKLSAKEENFVREYLIDLNATQAYLRSGYKVKNVAVAGQMGNRLLQKVKIQAAVQSHRAILKAKLDITQEKILREYARVAFFDISKLYDQNGHFKNIHDIDEDSRAAIAGIEVETLFENRERIGTLHKVKMSDKLRALADLAEHLGMFKHKVEVDLNANVVFKYILQTDEEIDKRIEQLIHTAGINGGADKAVAQLLAEAGVGGADGSQAEQKPLA